MSTPPPGWYPDETGQQRWWDGQQWQAPAAPPQAPTPRQPLGQQPLGQQPLGQQPLGQQPFGQQPFGQQPFPEQALPQRTAHYPSQHDVLPYTDVRLGGRWVIPVVVVLAIMTIAGVYVASLSTTDRVSAGDARDVVVQLTEAVVAGDCRGVQEATSQAYWAEVGWTCAQVTEDGEFMRANGVVFDVGTAVVDGDSGRVPVEVSLPDETSSGSFIVSKVSGHWVVTGEDDAAGGEDTTG